MTDVMISYSRRDGDFVRRLHEALEQTGRKVWVDWKDIPLSADWWEEIKAAIDGADTFVFVISPDSIASPICNLEIDHARRNNKRLVPLLYREAELDEVLEELLAQELADNTRTALGERDMDKVARDNWNAVARHNWVIFQDNVPLEENIERLISALETDLEHVREHTQLFTKAIEWQKRGRDNSFLLRGPAITEAEEWLTHAVNKNPPPTPLHAEFISQSRLADAARQRRRLATVTGVMVAAVALSILSLVLAWYANNQRVFAEQQQVLAEENAATATVAQGAALINADLAATSAADASRNADNANSLLWANAAAQSLDDGKSALALSLALAAVSIDNPPPLAQRTLADVAYAPGPIARFETDLQNRTAAINTVAFSPDGTSAAVGMADSNILFFDLRNESVMGSFSGHNAPVEEIQYTPDASQMLSVSGNTLILFDTATNEVVRQMRHGSGAITVVTALDISPDGNWALSGALDQTVVLWDLTSGEVIRELEGHTAQINDVAFSPDGLRAISGGNDNRLIRWDLESGAILNDIAADAQIQSLAYTSSNTLAVIGSRLGALALWNVETGEEVRRFGEDGVISPGLAVNSVDVYDNMILAGADDQRVTVWDMTTGVLLRVFDAHETGVESVRFSPDGRTALSGASDNLMYWWGITNDAINQHFNTNNRSQILSAAYAPESLQLLASSVNGDLMLWNSSNGRLERSYEMPLASPIATLSFSPDGSLFVTGTENGILALWETTGDGVVRTFNGHSGVIAQALFTPDGTHILAGDETGQLILWDATTSEQTLVLSGDGIEGGHSRAVLSLAMNADGTRALSGSEDRTVILWDLTTGEALQTFGRHGGRVVGVAFGEENTVLAGSNGDEIIVWDAETGTQLDAINIGVEGQTRIVNTVAFAPSRQLALVGRTDGVVVLLNLRNQRELASYVTGELDNSNRVTVLAFNPDGTEAVVGTRSGELYSVRTLLLPELIAWTLDQRFQSPLSCAERETFNILPLCNDEGLIPTFTPTPESVAAS